MNDLHSGKLSVTNQAEAHADIRRGPIRVDRYSLVAARAVNALLTVPIAVLPQAENDIIRPFRLGMGQDLKLLLRPEAKPKDLRDALRRYAYSA